LIVSLRPPFNASHVAEGRWNFIIVTETRRDALRFELTEVADHQTRRAYGCFPHLGRGVSSRPAIACSDGYTALLRLLWAASSDPASSYPGRITRSAPDRFQVGVEADLRAGMHAFLSGTSDRLLEALMSVCTTRRGAHLQPGLVRDRELAAGFFTYGPQALRRMRLRHRRRAGPMPRHVIEHLLAQEMRSMIADVRLVAQTDPRHDPLGRRAQRWTKPAVDARQAPDAADSRTLCGTPQLSGHPRGEVSRKTRPVRNPAQGSHTGQASRARRVVSVHVPPRTPRSGRPATSTHTTSPHGLCPSAGADPMTAAGVIAPVVPLQGTGHMAGRAGVVSLARDPLPLPELPPQRTSTVVYGASAIDDRGRVADRVVLRALGWPAGHRLAIRETAGALAVVPDPSGSHQVTGRGRLRIPAALRHRCGLATGDRVLLAADPDRSHLAIYSPVALDNALASAALIRFGGEPA
jgi:hypothetical protein